MATLSDLAVEIAGDIKGRAPAAHTHTQADITGLVAALAAKAAASHPALYDSGWRDITSLVPVPVASGKLYIARTGRTVWLDFDALLTTDLPSATWHSWTGVIPSGFRVNRNWPMISIAPTWSADSSGKMNAPSWAMGPVRPATSGHMVVYGAKNQAGDTVYPIQGLVSWMTRENPPTSLPGIPV